MIRVSLFAFAALGLLLALSGTSFASEDNEVVVTPEPKGSVLLLETFEDGDSNWVHSSNSKYSGKLKVSDDGFGGKAFEVPHKARHYGTSVKLEKPLDPSKGFVFQYEVTLQEGMECGGAYVKMLTDTPSLDLTELDGDTPYTIMFGPDKCGTTNKVHVIFRHKSPVTGEWEEKHLKAPPLMKTDKKPHLYSLLIEPDNSYQVLVDNEVEREGSLLEDFEPPFNPPATIPDPEEQKPEDWVDEAKIKDPEAVKPEDWDEDAPKQIEDEEAEMPEDWLPEEPLMIDDPEAEQPEDWDTEEDGDWESPKIKNPACEAASGCGPWKKPMIPNPEYKGKWSAPMIDNPAYKGPWAPQQIPNPSFFEDETPLKSVGKVGAVAIEIWTMSQAFSFDNLLMAYEEEVADDFAEKTWQVKFEKAAAKEEEEESEGEKGQLEGDFDAAGTLRNIVQAVAPTLLPQLEDLMKTVDPLALLAGLVLGPLLFIYVISKLFFPKKKVKKTKKVKKEEEKKEEKAEEEEDEEEKEEEEKKDQ